MGQWLKYRLKVFSLIANVLKPGDFILNITGLLGTGLEPCGAAQGLSSLSHLSPLWAPVSPIISVQLIISFLPGSLLSLACPKRLLWPQN